SIFGRTCVRCQFYFRAKIELTPTFPRRKDASMSHRARKASAPVPRYPQAARPVGQSVAALATIVALLLCFGHSSKGHQLVQGNVTAKVVVADAFILGPSGAQSAAILGRDPINQTTLNFFHPQNSRSLQVGAFRGGSPGLVFRSRNPQTEMTLS